MTKLLFSHIMILNSNHLTLILKIILLFLSNYPISKDAWMVLFISLGKVRFVFVKFYLNKYCLIE